MAARNRLRSFRGRMTRADLAEAQGVDQRTVTRWETGREEIPFEMAQRLAAGFGVTVEYLLGTELSDADEMILLVDSLSAEDRDTLGECWEAVGAALAVLPDDARRTLVRDLRDVRERLGYYFAAVS